MCSSFNLKLIPLFDVAELMVKWMEKAESICRLCNVKWLEHVIPLRLIVVVVVVVGAFDIYQQLRDKEKQDADKIKTSLYVAFTTDEFAACEQFKIGWMQPDKSVNVYLTEL